MTIPLRSDRVEDLVDSIFFGGSSTPVRAGGARAVGSGSQNIMSTPSQRNATRPLEVVTPIQKIPVEQMYINFEEWMKMATDNVNHLIILFI